MRPIIKYISEEELRGMAESAYGAMMPYSIQHSDHLKEIVIAAFIMGFRSSYTPAKFKVPGFENDNQ